MGHIQDSLKNTAVYLSEIGKLSEFMKKQVLPHEKRC